MGLPQTEAAQRLGLRKSGYLNIEKDSVQHIPKENVDRLAQVYGVPATDFLDEFSLPAWVRHFKGRA